MRSLETQKKVNIGRSILASIARETLLSVPTTTAANGVSMLALVAGTVCEGFVGGRLDVVITKGNENGRR